MSQNDRRRIALALFNTTMSGVDYRRRQLTFIWAAKHQTCPFCDEPPFHPCINMTIWRKRHEKVPTQNPHDQRINWARIVDGLRDRGYISEDVYFQTLKQMKEAE